MSEPEKPTQFMVDMPNLELALDATDIARLKRSEVIDLITETDRAVGDWTVTLLLYHYFKAEFEQAKRHAPIDAGKTEAELWEQLRHEEEAEEARESEEAA